LAVVEVELEAARRPEPDIRRERDLVGRDNVARARNASASSALASTCAREPATPAYADDSPYCASSLMKVSVSPKKSIS
jgi:hypothetical protein